MKVGDLVRVVIVDKRLCISRYLRIIKIDKIGYYKATDGVFDHYFNENRQYCGFEKLAYIKPMSILDKLIYFIWRMIYGKTY